MEYYHVGVLVFKYTDEFKQEVEYTITSYLKEDKSLNTQMDELEDEYKPQFEYKLTSRVFSLPTKLKWYHRLKYSKVRLCRIRSEKVERNEEYQHGYMEGFSDGQFKTYARNALVLAIAIVIAWLL